MKNAQKDLKTEEKEIENIDLWRIFYRAWKGLQRRAGENFTEIGISFLDYRILRYLTENGPVPMARIADFLLVTQGHITGIIDDLESRNLVRRNRSSTDRRIINIGLSKKGTLIEKKARTIHESFMVSAYGALDEHQKKCLYNSLLRLHDSLYITQ